VAKTVDTFKVFATLLAISNLRASLDPRNIETSLVCKIDLTTPSNIFIENEAHV
jgi:hypothetical protein